MFVTPKQIVFVHYLDMDYVIRNPVLAYAKTKAQISCAVDHHAGLSQAFQFSQLIYSDIAMALISLKVFVIMRLF